MCVCVFLYLCVGVYVCVHVCIQVCLCVCVCVCVCQGAHVTVLMFVFVKIIPPGACMRVFV